MKTNVSIIIISICLSATAYASPFTQIKGTSFEKASERTQIDHASDESEAISKCINAFARAGDINDAQELSTYLDSKFSIIMNRMFGSENVDLVDRETYLNKISTKEWGGDKRKVTIEQVTINGSTAFAKVALKGEKSSMTSLLGLVKDSEGAWKLIIDMPVM